MVGAWYWGAWCCRLPQAPAAEDEEDQKENECQRRRDTHPRFIARPSAKTHQAIVRNSDATANLKLTTWIRADLKVRTMSDGLRRT